MAMLLPWLLVAAQAAGVRSKHDLAHYLTIAARYRSAERDAAQGEIREWRGVEIEAATSALRRRADHLRAIPLGPDDIDFRTVEAAVLMHAEAGLLSLVALSGAEAKTHLDASVTLFDWSGRAAAAMRRRAEGLGTAGASPPLVAGIGIVGGLEIRERIDRREYYVALAAAALATGFPATARPFAEKARLVAPLDPEVQFVSGCVSASLAEEMDLRHRDSDAARARESAEKELRDALALDPGLQEARLRLGKLLLDERRAIEAEMPLTEADERGVDDRQRYLARLFLGRVADRRGRPDEAARHYWRALEAWPDSQAARLALAHAGEKSWGPAVARPLVAASLAASRRPDRADDPWWLYSFGPPGLAKSALDRVWTKGLGP